MSDQESKPDDGGQPEESRQNPAEQQVQIPGVTARVPASIGHGVVSTGAIVMNGPHAFVLDFLQQMGVPNQLVSRVVMPHSVVPRFIQALEQNLANYEQKFGAPMKLPRSAKPANRPSIHEVYDNIKIPDEELAGHFSEGVMIRHSAAEFCFDFVTQFFPNAAVASRVFMSRATCSSIAGSIESQLPKAILGRYATGRRSRYGTGASGHEERVTSASDQRA